MDSQFEASGHTYRYGRIDARRQAHIVRRLAPMMVSVTSASEAGSLSDLASIEPLTKAVAAMTDEDFDYVVDICLSVTSRQQDGGLGWAPVWSANARRMMFDDIDLLALLGIVSQVIQGNLGGFFRAGQSGLNAERPAAPATSL
ncbi:phage tail assembly chaperone [Pseudochelatococcus contaminans]|uniref:Bacteriophage protein n=1 Tax=Pseudochelatococcus contaminans TaxID=1538103 RepID=A0A7W5Z2A7_9HYPH|nr:hypothetical protein [Pseudochelatococcus contaminans]MBB3808752.1 hypothetical protein [Pseudochelatococcus contaminans]